MARAWTLTNVPTALVQAPCAPTRWAISRVASANRAFEAIPPLNLVSTSMNAMLLPASMELAPTPPDPIPARAVPVLT
jgi:hypothetical protein